VVRNRGICVVVWLETTENKNLPAYHLAYHLGGNVVYQGGGMLEIIENGGLTAYHMSGIPSIPPKYHVVVCYNIYINQ
jgi:hypothetical protein